MEKKTKSTFFFHPQIYWGLKKNALGIEKKPGRKQLLGMKRTRVGMNKQLMPIIFSEGDSGYPYP